jgi:hypothetical protein
VPGVARSDSVSSRGQAADQLGDPEGEVGASLKWATAKVERTSQRGNGECAQGRERAAERGGAFDDAPPSDLVYPAASSASRGRRFICSAT